MPHTVTTKKGDKMKYHNYYMMKNEVGCEYGQNAVGVASSTAVGNAGVEASHFDGRELMLPVMGLVVVVFAFAVLWMLERHPGGSSTAELGC